MLNKKIVLKMEQKLLKNKINNVKPSNKTELAKHLGTTRQQIWYSCNTLGINESANVEQKIIEWVNS